jgi:hypothetical protein
MITTQPQGKETGNVFFGDAKTNPEAERGECAHALLRLASTRPRNSTESRSGSQRDGEVGPGETSW